MSSVKTTTEQPGWSARKSWRSLPCGGHGRAVGKIAQSAELRAENCAENCAAAHRLAADADVERLLVEVRVGERPARRVADGALLDREPRARVEDERRERRDALRHQLRVLLLGRAHKVLDAAAVDEDGAPAARSAVGPRVLQRDRRDVEDLEVEAARRRDDLHEPLHHAGVPRAVAPRELLQRLPRVDHEWSASRVRRSERRGQRRQHFGRGNAPNAAPSAASASVEAAFYAARVDLPGFHATEPATEKLLASAPRMSWARPACRRRSISPHLERWQTENFSSSTASPTALKNG